MSRCCPKCPRVSTDSGTTRHRKYCKIFKQYVASSQLLERQMLEARRRADRDARTKSRESTQTGGNPSSSSRVDSGVQGSDSDMTMQIDDNMTAVGRPQRVRRLPARYQDVYPEPPTPAGSLSIPEAVVPSAAPASAPSGSLSIPEAVVPTAAPTSAPPGTTHKRVILIAYNRFQTTPNAFGLWKEYLYRPSYDPDAIISADDLYCPHASTINHVPDLDDDDFSGYSNKVAELLMSWQNTGSAKKTNKETDRLVHNVLLHPDFSLDLLRNFNAARENRKTDLSDRYFRSFQHANVKILVPSGSKHVPPQSFTIPGLYYRKITALIKESFESPLSAMFHFSPFKLFRKHPDSGASERIFSDIYDSDVFLDEHAKVQHAPTDDPTCKREKIVAALMFWSDATRVATFGTAKLWPIYMLFGNLSKYVRCQPNSGATKHLAYIPPFPDSLQDHLKTFHHKWATQQSDILTHCRRELMHSVWKFLLDDDFTHAYHHGMVVRCHDGFERRIYPRVFTYSADYPEKVLLATIRDKGLCPCPRCLVPKPKLDQLGRIVDANKRIEKPRKYLANAVENARRAIYDLGKPITGVDVQRLLKDTSSVPTVNAFIERLGPKFNLSHMLVVDFMHEVELGVWKALFIHLIRLLYAVVPSGRLVSRLDERYRQTPPFGETIRRFSNNMSETKQLAARDYEDLLQCSIPAFEGLLEKPHDSRLMKLLYRTAEWHAFAKLRMHSDRTLTHLESLTKEFGLLMRQFRDLTCSQFETMELPREVTARNRRTSHAHTLPSASKSQPTAATVPSSRKPKTLNLLTPKFHSLGDYMSTIPLFGCTDGFSTQVGEQAHRLVKQLYGRTNKHDEAKQIGRNVRRLERAQLASEWQKREKHDAAEDIGIGQNMDTRYHMSNSHNDPVDIYSYVLANEGDPALSGFIPKLKDHILGRLLGREYEGDTYGTFSDIERSSVRIIGERIYRCKTLRINYTTYDVRRDADSINPRTYSDIMVKSPETGPHAQPFWYARVIGIFHGLVSSSHQEVKECSSRPMNFLWVRWFGVEPGRYRSGFSNARLPKIGFVESTDDYAFTFLDPAQVIRGVHLIPAFSEGRTSILLPVSKSIARVKDPEEVDDWTNFYVNIFVDRDMIMRHFGHGVGHIQYDRLPEVECDPRLETEGGDNDGDKTDTEDSGAWESDHVNSDIELEDGEDVEVDSNDEGEIGMIDVEDSDSDRDSDSANDSDGYASL